MELERLKKVTKKAGQKIGQIVLTLWYCMRDHDTPIAIKTAIVGDFLYLISPIDAIPDFLPGGFVDDLSILSATLVAFAVYVKKAHREAAQEKLEQWFPSSVRLRSATIADAELLAEIGRQTFSETFADTNSAADMQMYLNETFSEAKQTEELKDPSRRIYLSEIEGKAVGYLHLLLHAEDQSLEVLRIYVLSGWHGKGVAASMMEKCFEVARAEKCRTIWLGVWENNLRAQAFYRKYDFAQTGKHDFMLGTDRQTDFIFSRPV